MYARVVSAYVVLCFAKKKRVISMSSVQPMAAACMCVQSMIIYQVLFANNVYHVAKQSSVNLYISCSDYCSSSGVVLKKEVNIAHHPNLSAWGSGP